MDIQSRILIPTQKEDPSDAETISHKLTIRAGLIQKLASGIYNMLPVGLRVQRKIETIIRQQMNQAGASELLMPSVIPAELWQQSQRYEQYGPELLRIKDRHQRDFVVGPTHEEVITDIARRSVSSYKQLPINLYQIQAKFRDEVRPRFGIMRGREFLMKDAYSFHVTEDCLDQTYQAMAQAYSQIFAHCGLEFVVVDADSGSIGGSISQEFMVLAHNGEDALLHCSQCNYGANVEKATFGLGADQPTTANGSTTGEKVHTPDTSSIEEVAALLKVSPAETLKTLVVVSDQGAEVLCIRGDRQLQEQKFASAIGAQWLRPASDEEIAELTGAPVGFLGPQELVDLDGVRVWFDRSASAMGTCVTGANETDYHRTGVVLGPLINEHNTVDAALAEEGDPCPNCQNPMEQLRGIEVGHIFKLGTKYSETMDATVLDQNGKAQNLIMGCYGIGVTRTLAAAIEQNHDERGICWPSSIAPWQVHILILDPKNDGVVQTARAIAQMLDQQGYEVLLDDRDERAGAKFADADLIGCSSQIIVGARGLKNNQVEFKLRQTQQKYDIALSDDIADAAGTIKQHLEDAQICVPSYDTYPRI